MSTKLKLVASTEAVARKPQQGRSKASLERMLAATEQLMLERGSEEFTLQEVSAVGRVSIGSIYLRFKGKDELVRAVIFDHLERQQRDEEGMLLRVRSDSGALAEFMPNYVDAYAETLRKHAPLMRLAMLRADYDSLVSTPGKARALDAATAGAAAMLEHAGEFGGSDHGLKASSAYHIIFATLARQLSIGSTEEQANDYNWQLLKRELARMCLAYLKSPE